MNNHVKAGLLVMLAWNVIVALLWGSYLVATNQSVEYFIDEDTGGFITAAFLTAWSLIWYGIGCHYHKEYTLKKEAYIKMFSFGRSEKEVAREFQTAYLSKYSKMLSRVFFVFVLAFVALHAATDLLTVRCLAELGVLMALSIVFYAYYKRHSMGVAL